MDITNYSEFRGSLKSFLDKVIKNHSLLIVKRQTEGDVVVMSLEDYNSFRETIDILSHPLNAEHIRQSLSQANHGFRVELDINELENRIENK